MVVSKFSAAATLWNWENNCFYGAGVYRKLNIDYGGVNFSVKKKKHKIHTNDLCSYSYSVIADKQTMECVVLPVFRICM